MTEWMSMSAAQREACQESEGRKLLARRRTLLAQIRKEYQELSKGVRDKAK